MYNFKLPSKNQKIKQLKEENERLLSELSAARKIVKLYNWQMDSIEKNMTENNLDKARLILEGEIYEGPAVEWTHKVLKGLLDIGKTALKDHETINDLPNGDITIEFEHVHGGWVGYVLYYPENGWIVSSERRSVYARTRLYPTREEAVLALPEAIHKIKSEWRYLKHGT